MVAECRKNLSPAFGDRLELRCLDSLDLDDREAYDLVFSTATFHWILDHDRLFRVIHRALRPRRAARGPGGVARAT